MFSSLTFIFVDVSSSLLLICISQFDFYIQVIWLLYTETSRIVLLLHQLIHVEKAKLIHHPHWLRPTRPPRYESEESDCYSYLLILSCK